MSKEDFYSELWSLFEYFLGFYSEGIHLKCFSLIDKDKSMPGKGEAYLYEKITRKIMANSAGELRAYAKEYVETEKLDQIDGTSQAFKDSLKEIALKNTWGARVVNISI